MFLRVVYVHAIDSLVLCCEYRMDTLFVLNLLLSLFILKCVCINHEVSKHFCEPNKCAKRSHDFTDFQGLKSHRTLWLTISDSPFMNPCCAIP